MAAIAKRCSPSSARPAWTSTPSRPNFRKRARRPSSRRGTSCSKSLPQRVRRWAGRPDGRLSAQLKVLAVDVGGTHVKILASGEKEHREFASGPKLTPRRMVARVKGLARGWRYDHVSVG